MLMTKEEIIKRCRKYNEEVLNTFEIGKYFIVQYKDREEDILYRGYILNENNTKELSSVYRNLDACLLECICCNYENISSSHATDYIMRMLNIEW